MASNSSTQNPANKVGRNSGAGRAGISELVPTEAEARRGLEPIQLSDSSGWAAPLAVGLAVAALGVGVAAMLNERAKRQRSLRYRLENLVPWR